MQPGRPTLDSVARHAQVSRQTVSNVLNAPHLVRPDTKDRVQASIDQLGYRANRAAQQLRTRRSQVIGMRIEPQRDGVNGVVFDRFMHTLTETAQEHGYRVMLFTAPDDGAEIAAYDDLLAALDLDAFVLTSTHYGDPRTAWLRDRGVPFVTFGRPWGDEGSHCWVDVDGAAGTSDAVEHLVERGHRRIAFLGWPAGSGVGDDRREGWRRALRANDLPEDGLDVGIEDGFDDGRRAAADVLDAVAPTAFLCASDSLAVGVLTELRSRGLSAGPDVAVVGFDDTPVAGAIGLSSISQPLTDVAAECARLLNRLLDPAPGAPERPGHVLFRPRLMVRASSSAPGPHGVD